MKRDYTKSLGPPSQKRCNVCTLGGWPLLTALIAMALFLSLGFWQLRRAEEKRVLEAIYEQRSVGAVVRLDATPGTANALKYHPLEARGTYDAEYQILLDNQKHDNRPGYHVITPLRIEGGQTRVLVNRGWVPVEGDRSRVPAVDAPTGVVTVRGIAAVPAPGLILGNLPAPSANRAVVWPQLDLSRYAAVVPFAVQPVVIQLDARSDAGGFVRQWPRPASGVSMHYGYAFQWFALALTTLVLTIVITLRALRPRAK